MSHYRTNCFRKARLPSPQALLKLQSLHPVLLLPHHRLAVVVTRDKAHGFVVYLPQPYVLSQGRQCIQTCTPVSSRSSSFVPASCFKICQSTSNVETWKHFPNQCATCKGFKFPRDFQFKILCDLTAEAEGIEIHNYLPCNAWSVVMRGVHSQPVHALHNSLLFMTGRDSTVDTWLSLMRMYHDSWISLEL